VLLYNLTSAYFESSQPDDENDKQRYRYKPRQAQRLRPGDGRTRPSMARPIASGLLDRGMPSNEVLAEMRKANPPVWYLVAQGPAFQTGEGAAQFPGRRFARGPMSSFSCGSGRCTCGRRAAHASTRNAPCGDASSNDYGRVSGRSRRWRIPHARNLKLGAARSKAGAAWRLIAVEVAEQMPPPLPSRSTATSRERRGARGAQSAAHQSVRRGSAKLWKFYIQLVEIEVAFKNLKDDL
jgi:hypothetical protein